MRDRSCARPSETSLSAHCLSDRGRRPRFCCWIYRPNKYHARGQAGAATWHFYHRPRWLRLRLRCGFLLDAVRTADGSIRYEGRTSSRTAACFGPSPRAKSTAVQRSECIYKPGGTPRGLFQCFLALLHPGGVEAPPQPTLRPGLPNAGMHRAKSATLRLPVQQMQKTQHQIHYRERMRLGSPRPKISRHPKLPSPLSLIACKAPFAHGLLQ
jgi:hypothetical protein